MRTSLIVAATLSCLAAGQVLADESYVVGSVSGGDSVGHGSGGVFASFVGFAGTNSRAGSTQNVASGGVEGYIAGSGGAVEGVAAAGAEGYVGRGTVFSASSAQSGGEVSVGGGVGVLRTSASAVSASATGRHYH